MTITKARFRIRIPNAKVYRLVGVLSLSFIVWRLTLTAEVKSMLAEISRRGEPVNIAQLNARHFDVPDDQNAALMWLAGFDRLVPTNKSFWNAPWSNLKLPFNSRTSPTAESLQQAVSLLESNRMAMDTFRRAAAMAKCQYPVDFAETLWVNAPPLSKLRSIAHLLRVEAYVVAMEGDVDSATGAILILLALGESLRDEPAGDSIRLRGWINSIACNSLERVLNRAPLGDVHLGQLAAAFARSADDQMLARELIAKRAEMTTILQQPYWYLSNYGQPRSLTTFERAEATAAVVVVRATGLFARDLRFGLNAFESTISHVSMPHATRFQARKKCEMFEQQARNSFHIESETFLMFASEAIGQDTKRRAAAHLARTAIAIEQYRMAHGAPPDQLTSLSPYLPASVLTDPFDGQPLRYQACGDDYAVYSVGPDMADNGGAERAPEARFGMPVDMTFIVE